MAGNTELTAKNVTSDFTKEIVPAEIKNVEPEPSVKVDTNLNPATLPQSTIHTDDEAKNDLPVDVESKTNPAPEINIPVANSPLPPAVKSNNDILTKLSLTRRFEYINNLFGGDAVAFATFLDELLSQNTMQNVTEKFNAEGEKRNWKRKAESADDLRQFLRKMF